MRLRGFAIVTHAIIEVPVRIWCVCMISNDVPEFHLYCLRFAQQSALSDGGVLCHKHRGIWLRRPSAILGMRSVSVSGTGRLQHYASLESMGERKIRTQGLGDYLFRFY